MRVYVFGAGGHAKVVVGSLLDLVTVVEGLSMTGPICGKGRVRGEGPRPYHGSKLK